MPNNTQLLQAILENQRIDKEERLNYQKEISRKFLKLAAEFSDYKNKQEPINLKILAILNNDKGSSRKGMIDQVDTNTKDIQDIKTREKVLVGQKSVVSIIAGGLGAVVVFIIKLIW